MKNNSVVIENHYQQLNPFQGLVIYRPVDPTNRKPVGIVLMHLDEAYYGFIPAPELAQRGYTVFTAAVKRSEETLDQKILDVKAVVDYVKQDDAIKKFLLLGHSGGATLLSAYQAIAENGAHIFQTERQVVKLTDVGDLTPADGVMFLDSNFGNGVMELLSLDPGLTEGDSARYLNPKFDLTSPENGWCGDHGEYSSAFIRAYQQAQAERQQKLVDDALARLNAIEAGQGKFKDDEPLTIVGGQQFAPCNKLFPQDPTLLQHTAKPWDLIHADGSISNEVIYSRRLPRAAQQFVQLNNLSTKQTTVKNFLTNFGLRTKGFGYDATHVYGIDWDSAYCNTPGNVRHIQVPTLIMGMTGSYEFMAAEAIYQNSSSPDKQMAFVDGASHNIVPEKAAERFAGEFGDTVRNCFEHVNSWLEERF